MGALLELVEDLRAMGRTGNLPAVHFIDEPEFARLKQDPEVVDALRGKQDPRAITALKVLDVEVRAFTIIPPYA